MNDWGGAACLAIEAMDLAWASSNKRGYLGHGYQPRHTKFALESAIEARLKSSVPILAEI